MTVPTEVISAIQNRWPDRVGPWLNAVDNELAGLCENYVAQPVQVFSARYSYVVATIGLHGKLVFRGTPDPLGAAQALVSQVLAERDVGPTIYENIATSTGCWTVMDQVVPGTPLHAGVEAQTAVARLLSPLVDQAAPGRLPYIGDWLKSRLESENVADLAPGRRLASDSERGHAIDVLRELMNTGDRALCHGDTSPGNVLVGESSLSLIDPRGFSGEAAYDVAVIALKASMDIAPLARAIGVPADRVRAWATVASIARV